MWFFFDLKEFYMLTGYQVVNGEIYYFNEDKNGTIPYGALVTSAMTPLGFMANEKGEVPDYKAFVKTTDLPIAKSLN